ncbi:hypothetical protein AGLY_005179 [Aphis glycines]|uniref:Uncharacterized protein n=1 Tax=Aphis glycines TaxID=307491 RepID=A0A6G0TWW7_APHGL|nr:hypothetical protein AGLY_005179 [Aphis glycines]
MLLIFTQENNVEKYVPISAHTLNVKKHITLCNKEHKKYIKQLWAGLFKNTPIRNFFIFSALFRILVFNFSLINEFMVFIKSLQVYKHIMSINCIDLCTLTHKYKLLTFNGKAKYVSKQASNTNTAVRASGVIKIDAILAIDVKVPLKFVPRTTAPIYFVGSLAAIPKTELFWYLRGINHHQRNSENKTKYFNLAFINMFQGINIPIPCRTKIKYTISSFGKLVSSHAGVKRTGTCSEATLYLILEGYCLECGIQLRLCLRDYSTIKDFDSLRLSEKRFKFPNYEYIILKYIILNGKLGLHRLHKYYFDFTVFDYLHTTHLTRRKQLSIMSVTKQLVIPLGINVVTRMFELTELIGEKHTKSIALDSILHLGLLNELGIGGENFKFRKNGINLYS